MMLLTFVREGYEGHRVFADDAEGVTFAQWLASKGVEASVSTTCRPHNGLATNSHVVGRTPYLMCDECILDKARLSTESERERRRQRVASEQAWSRQIGQYNRY
jgi:hypothetical protein